MNPSSGATERALEMASALGQLPSALLWSSREVGTRALDVGTRVVGQGRGLVDTTVSAVLKGMNIERGVGVDAERRTTARRRGSDSETDDVLDDMTDVLENDEIDHGEPSVSMSVHVTPPSVLKLLTLDEQLERQRRRCAGCSSKLRVPERGNALRVLTDAFRPFRSYQRCEYDGFVYCDACAPPTSFAVIPWRVMENFDWKPRRVSNHSRCFIARIEKIPIFVPRDVDPTLYVKCKPLADFRDARVRARCAVDALRAAGDSSSARALANEFSSSPVARAVVDDVFDAEAFSLDCMFAVHKNSKNAIAVVRRLESEATRRRRAAVHP